MNDYLGLALAIGPEVAIVLGWIGFRLYQRSVRRQGRPQPVRTEKAPTP